MLNDELENIWQKYTKAEVVNFNRSELLIDLKSQLKRFDRMLKNRDRREIIAGAMVILLSGAGAFFFTEILSRIGLVLGVLYGFLVIYMLTNVKKHKPDNYALPIKDYLVKYRMYLVKERNLLDNVIYWYLLPPFISSVLFFIGQHTGIILLTILIIFVFGLYTFIYFLNKSGVKKSFDPLIKKLDETINDFETTT
ncbi:MAG: hypothetical protein M0Q38_10900 [Bacteroidales bacterium]|jgi:positive regulator of sigma E activity|nr:hypothetical protein [Bacteroidales bacterium]